LKLLFRRSCSCKLLEGELPKPSFKVTSKPDITAASPEAKITFDLICPSCGKAWESFAAINAPMKKPRLIVDPSEVDGVIKKHRN
jgi:hypothetical protein